MAFVGFRGACRTCCTECTIDSDNFDRADSTDLGDKWTEASGDWSIVSNRLKPPLITSGNRLIFATEDPGTDDGIRWSAVFNFGGTSAGSAEWIVDWVDSNNFNMARVVCSDATTATLQLFQMTGGSFTALTSAIGLSGFDWATDFTLAVCWGFAFLDADCVGQEIPWRWTDLNGEGNWGWRANAIPDACLADPPGWTPESNAEDTYFDTTTAYLRPDGLFADHYKILQATFNGSRGLDAAADDHGGTKVGFGATLIGANGRFDDATLSRLKDGCPSCETPTFCEFCRSGTATRELLIEVTGITSGTCDDCYYLNGTYVITRSTEALVSKSCDVENPEILGNACFWFGEFIPVDETRYCNAKGVTIDFAIGKNPDGEFYAWGMVRFRSDSVSAPFSPTGTFYKAISDFAEDETADCRALIDDVELPFNCDYTPSPENSCDYSNAIFRVRAI